MAIQLFDNFKLGAAKPIDDRYLAADLQPYTNTAAAIAAVPVLRRHVGLKVLVDTVEGPKEYWWKDDTTDLGLVIVETGGSGTTDLSTSTAATTVTIESSTGAPAVINAATGSVAGVMTAADRTKLDGVAANANNYTLPVATTTVIGGVKRNTGSGYVTGIDSSGNLTYGTPSEGTGDVEGPDGIASANLLVQFADTTGKVVSSTGMEYDVSGAGPSTTITLNGQAPILSLSSNGALSSGVVNLTTTGVQLVTESLTSSANFNNNEFSFVIGNIERWSLTEDGLALGSGERVNSISSDTALGTSNTIIPTQGAAKAYIDARSYVAKVVGGAPENDLDINATTPLQFEGSGGLSVQADPVTNKLTFSLYTTPSVGSFTVSGSGFSPSSGGFVELGTVVPTTLNMNFSFSPNADNVVNNTLAFTSPAGTPFVASVPTSGVAKSPLTYAITGVPAGISGPSTGGGTTSGATTNASKTYRIAANHLQGTIQRDFSYTVGLPHYWGKSLTDPTANEALVLSGTKVVSSSSGTVTVPFATGGTPQFLWAAIPACYSKTKWNQTGSTINAGDIGGEADLFRAVNGVSVTTVLWSGQAYNIYVTRYVTDVASLQFTT